jgi:hypothetical protein
MKTEISPRSRSVISGVSATAITVLVMAWLVEALNPALLMSHGPQADAERIAAIQDPNSASVESKA